MTKYRFVPCISIPPDEYYRIEKLVRRPGILPFTAVEHWAYEGICRKDHLDKTIRHLESGVQYADAL